MFNESRNKVVIKRIEGKSGPAPSYASTITAIQQALEQAGVIFVAENGDGPGVRLRKTVAKALAHDDASLDRQIAEQTLYR